VPEWHERVIAQVHAGRHREAAGELREIIRAHPHLTDAVIVLGAVCLPQRWLGDYAGGLKDARDGGNPAPEILEDLVITHLRLGKPAEARRYLDDFLGAHPRRRTLGGFRLEDLWREIALQHRGASPKRVRPAAGAARPSARAKLTTAPGRSTPGSGTPPVRRIRQPSVPAAVPPASRTKPTSPRKSAARAPERAAKPAEPPPPLLSRIPLGSINIEVSVEAKGLARRLECGETDGLLRHRLCLEGHRLSMVGSLDELLCLAHLHGVRELWYQVETVRKVLRRFRGRALLCDEVGLGKTIEAGMAIKEYSLRNLIRSVLVLVPPTLVQQWKEEMEAKFGLAFATTADAAHKIDPDAFWRDQRMVIASLALARTSRHRERVAASRFDLVVVDEAHHLRNRNTEAWKLVDRVKSPFLLLLTATPLQNNLEELHNLITLLKPGQLATRTAFLREFVSKEDPTRPLNEEKLRVLLSEVMVRNTRALAGLRLPPRHARTLVLEPSPVEAELYERLSALVRTRYRRDSASGESTADTKRGPGTTQGPGGEQGPGNEQGPETEPGSQSENDGALNRLTLRLLQMEAGSSPAALARTLGRLEEGHPDTDALGRELRDLRRIASGLGTHTKVEALSADLRAQRDQTIVFVTWRETLAFVDAGLRRVGIEPIIFHGGMAAAEKESAIDRFRDGGPVLLTTEVGGEGRNLQFCRRLVNFDLPWNPMRIEQRIGRIHRIGQEREIEIVNICARGSVEDHLLEILDRKINLFELVIGEVDMILGRLDDKREFPERVMEAWAGADTTEQAVGNFGRLAEELGRAKEDYERIKTLDTALFGEDYEA
jgi:superfamily II DNA or RNA helicase